MDLEKLQTEDSPVFKECKKILNSLYKQNTELHRKVKSLDREIRVFKVWLIGAFIFMNVAIFLQNIWLGKV